MYNVHTLTMMRETCEEFNNQHCIPAFDASDMERFFYWTGE